MEVLFFPVFLLENLCIHINGASPVVIIFSRTNGLVDGSKSNETMTLAPSAIFQSRLFLVWFLVFKPVQSAWCSSRCPQIVSEVVKLSTFTSHILKPSARISTASPTKSPAALSASSSSSTSVATSNSSPAGGAEASFTFDFALQRLSCEKLTCFAR